MTEGLLSAKQVAERFGISARAAYNLPLPRYQVTKRGVRFHPNDVQAYLEASFRPTRIKKPDAGATPIVDVRARNPSALLRAFRKLGVEHKPRPMSAKRTPGSMKFSLVVNNRDTQ